VFVPGKFFWFPLIKAWSLPTEFATIRCSTNVNSGLNLEY
jgi:hypothetical protein